MQIELARPTVPVYTAEKRRTIEATINQIRWLEKHNRIARVVKRKDGKITRVYMKPMPGECCRYPSAEDNTTTKQDLPLTYSHHANRSAAYGVALGQMA